MDKWTETDEVTRFQDKRILVEWDKSGRVITPEQRKQFESDPYQIFKPQLKE